MNQDLKNQIEVAEGLFTELKENSEKFLDKGNKAAGTRTRANAMIIIKAMKNIRLTVSDIKNS